MDMALLWTARPKQVSLYCQIFKKVGNSLNWLLVNTIFRISYSQKHRYGKAKDKENNKNFKEEFVNKDYVFHRVKTFKKIFISSFRFVLHFFCYEKLELELKKIGKNGIFEGSMLQNTRKK